ncbi:hypothetical protein AGMMS49593_07600 [Endomicrobiia bacterium]|nr:hypothetical protein AGMMS49593_07600 [Endomicrobiia bacterium]
MQTKAKSIEMADESATGFWYDTRNAWFEAKKAWAEFKNEQLMKVFEAERDERSADNALSALSWKNNFYGTSKTEEEKKEKEEKDKEKNEKKKLQAQIRAAQIRADRARGWVKFGRNNEAKTEAKANIAEARAKDTEKMRTILRKINELEKARGLREIKKKAKSLKKVAD